MKSELEFLGELLFASSYDLYEVENPKEYVMGVLKEVNKMVSDRIDEVNNKNIEQEKKYIYNPVCKNYIEVKKNKKGIDE